MTDVPDLLSIGSGGKLSSSAPQDGDPAIWTVLGEAGADPEGQKAVASVIANRTAKSGESAADLVGDPKEGFEAWTPDKRAALQKQYPVDSDAYKAAQANVGAILAGSADAPYPYDAFYSPSGQRALGRAAPYWEDGSGVDIAGNRFFSGKYTPQVPDLLSIAGRKASVTDTPDASTAATIKSANGQLTFGDTGAAIPSVQSKTIDTLNKAGLISDKAEPGSIGKPWVQREPTDVFKPGEWFIDPNGTLQRTPGGEQDGTAANAAAGFGQGISDVANSLAKFAPGAQNSELGAVLDANRLVYSAENHGLAGKTGRFLGQMTASAPLLGGAGEGLNIAGAGLRSAAPGAAPALDFLGGQGGGNLLMRSGSRVAQGALQGAGYSGLTYAADPNRSFGQQVAQGAEFGGIAGPLTPFAAKGVHAGINQLFGEPTIAPEVADLARIAIDKYKIPLRRSQVLGTADRNMAVTDSERLSAHGTGYAENQDAQKQAFTRAVAGTFGSDADKLTPDVMSAARSRIGDVFENVAKNTNITDTNGLTSRLQAVVDDAAQVLPESDLAPIQKQVDNIRSSIKDGVLSGETYQALTRKGTPLDRATQSANPNIRAAAQDIRSALDDALEEHASPDDLAALQQARWQYKNLMTVKNLAAKAGVTGEISPLLLNGAVNTSFKNRAFTGAGDLGELAQIGQTFLKEPPNSGTPARIKNMLMAAAGGGAGIADLGLAIHDPATAIKLAGLGALGAGINYGKNAAIGAYNRSPGAVNRLIEGAYAAEPRDLSTVDLNFRPLNDNAGFLGAALGNHLLQLFPSRPVDQVQVNQ